MLIRVVVEPREQFDAWVQQQRQPAARPATPAALRGEQVFLQNTCVNCHAIQGTDASGRVGPDLTHVGSRATLGSGVVANTPENMRRWVTDAQAIKPGVLMPRFNLPADDASAIADYLEGLK
jgi:cytochrome c oxidase subunit 2